MVERKKPGKRQQPNQKQFQLVMEVNKTHYYVVDDTDHEAMREILIIEEQQIVNA